MNGAFRWESGTVDVSRAWRRTLPSHDHRRARRTDRAGHRCVDDIGELHEHFPFGRVCQPDDVADVVRSLVGPRWSYVSGVRIRVDGGGQRIIRPR